VIDEIAAHLARWILAATRIRRGSGNAGARKQLWLESHRAAPLDKDVTLEVIDGRGALQAPQPMQTYRIRLDQLEQRNASHNHTGEVEAARWRATEAMTNDEARRIAVNVAQLPELLVKGERETRRS
jgi:hypothetical protein